MEQELPHLHRTSPSAPILKSKPRAYRLLSSPHLNLPGQKMFLQTKSPPWPQPYSQMKPQSQPAPGILLQLCPAAKNFHTALIQKVQPFALMQFIRQELMLWMTPNPMKKTRRHLGNQLWSQAETSRLQASTSTYTELDRGPAQPAFLVVTGGLRAHPVSLLQSQPDPLDPSSPGCPHCQDCAMWVKWLAQFVALLLFECVDMVTQQVTIKLLFFFFTFSCQPFTQMEVIASKCKGTPKQRGLLWCFCTIMELFVGLSRWFCAIKKNIEIIFF